MTTKRQPMPIRVTDELRIIGLPLAPISVETAMSLAMQLLRKASRRTVIDEVKRTRAAPEYRRIR